MPTSIKPMDGQLASQLAVMALQNIAQEYPNKLDHVLNGAHDLRSPRDLHPVFFGSFDWHSCVHMCWSLLRLLRVAPELAQAQLIRNWFDDNLTAEKIQQECAYMAEPLRQSFERTYGWAWLLKLQLELDLLSASFTPAQNWARICSR